MQKCVCRLSFFLRGISSDGRASALQAESRGFDSLMLHSILRGRAAEARLPHKQKDSGSSPLRATNKERWQSGQVTGCNPEYDGSIPSLLSKT